MKGNLRPFQARLKTPFWTSDPATSHAAAAKAMANRYMHECFSHQGKDEVEVTSESGKTIVFAIEQAVTVHKKETA